MKVVYVANDGCQFDNEQDCRSWEERKGLEKTPYARSLESFTNKDLRRAALDYSKWLRAKQDYPATDSGEHKCCDLLNEMAARL